MLQLDNQVYLIDLRFAPMLLISVSGYEDPQIVVSYQLRKSNSLNMLSFLSKAAWMRKAKVNASIKY